MIPWLLLTALDLVLPGPGTQPGFRGRLGLALVFLFTASGHFFRPKAMAEMLPPRVPARISIICLTGILEVAGAIGLLVPSMYRWAGICLILFLVAVLPANLYAAFHRIEMGGHGQGPRYLWLRLPLQIVLIAWTYWFAVRSSA